MNKHAIKLWVCIVLGFVSNCFAGNEIQLTYTFGDINSFNTIASDFEKSTGIHLVAKFQLHEELKTDLMILQELNTVPDVVIIPADHVGLHNHIHYSVIDPSLFKANISSRIWKSAMSDGAIYGAPISQGNHLVLYYNKKLVKNVAKTWDDIFAQKESFDNQGITTIAWDIDEPFYFLPFMSAYETWPIIDGKINLNTQSVVDALNFYRDLRVRHVSKKVCKFQCIVEKFKKDEIAYHINGEWQARSFHDVMGDNLGVSALPAIGDRKMRPSFSTYVIAFPKNSFEQSKRELLIKLVDYLQSTRIQEQLWHDTGAIPVETQAFNSVREHANPYLKDVLTLMADTKPLPADESMSFIWDALGKGLIRFNLDGMDPAKTSAYMQQLAERHLHNLKQKNMGALPE